MTLIKSISGIRGTIGGQPGESLTPIDIVKFTAAYGQMLLEESPANKSIVVGRDARTTGPMITQLVAGTLQSLGIKVVDAGLATTPTVEMAVTHVGAMGGIILTASHNPGQWNALKLLNAKGEFISAEQGQQVLSLAEKAAFPFVEHQKIGDYQQRNDFLTYHIEQILALPWVDVEAIKKRQFTVVVDAVNSVGGIAVPALLEALGVEQVVKLYCEPNGKFPHNPEPLTENLSAIAAEVEKEQADLGIVVDPDVDRLALVNEDGTMFGEEYTLVAVADYVLQQQSGNTVSNLSSTRALQDVTQKHGGQYFASAVGEVNVVAAMKEHEAIIGGEGNGGVIVPALHYGRDALAGIALFLSHLARFGKSCSMLRSTYPNYYISKNKIQLTPEVNVDAVLAAIKKQYQHQEINEIDGLKIHFDTDWVHLRKSNTEPIIRIYAESSSETTAASIANKIMEDIRDVVKNR